MDDLLREFLMESAENLAEIDVELVQFEQNPNDKELLGNIFRLVHTVKGTCGFLGLVRLESVAHASENVLGKIRDGELKVTPDAISLILESIDAIKDIMAALEKTEADPKGNDKDPIARLHALPDGQAAPATASAGNSRVSVFYAPPPPRPPEATELAPLGIDAPPRLGDGWKSG